MQKGINCFEGNLAVIESDDEMKDIPKSQLSEGADVSDLLIFDGDSITIDRDESKKLAKEIKDLANELFFIMNLVLE